jgi:hypothetical protein
LLGVALSNLGRYDQQLSLFEGNEKLHRAVDDVRERYEYESMRVALTLARSRGRATEDA